jgi:hypothetical protein
VTTRAGGGQLARRSVPKAGAILVHKLPGPCQRAFHFFRDERLATLPQVTPTKWRAPPQGKRRNQATAARTFGIKRIDAGTAMPKTWLALVLHVSCITPSKCAAGLNKSVIR